MILDTLKAHDCWDFGSGLNSLQWLVEYTSVKNPLAINIEEGRLSEIQREGFPTLRCSVLDLPPGVSTQVVAMCHFLEHLPDEGSARTVIHRALSQAADLLIITGPYFEDDERLRGLGFKFNWGSWVDHSSRYSLTQICEVLDERGVEFTASLGFGEGSTRASNIFDVRDLDNQDGYDAGRHRAKKIFDLPRHFYQEFMVCVSRGGLVNRASAVHGARHGKYGELRYHLLKHQDTLGAEVNRFLRCV